MSFELVNHTEKRGRFSTVPTIRVKSPLVVLNKKAVMDILNGKSSCIQIFVDYDVAKLGIREFVQGETEGFSVRVHKSGQGGLAGFVWSPMVCGAALRPSGKSAATFELVRSDDKNMWIADLTDAKNSKD